jgi:ribosomal-protein-alanine N-acetyltransferase
MVVLKTNIDELVLRPFKVEDAESYSRYANNYNIWKFMRDEFPHPYTYYHAVEYINDVCIPNKGNYFAIDYQGTAIGDIHIEKQTDILRLSGFLGYWLAEEFWGKGFVTEAVKAITGHAFDNLGLNRVFARVFANNAGSIRVLEKAGYEREGYFKNAIIKEGVILDQLQYAILKP